MLRKLTAVVIAVAVVLGLFWLMHRLILGGDVTANRGEPTQAIDFVRIKRDEQPEARQRQKPEPPPPPKEPPPPPKMKVESDTPPQESPVPFDMPNLGLASAVGGGPFLGQLGTGGGGLGTFDGDIIPLARIAPQYPRQAARDGIEGWVKLEIVVNPDGSVQSVDVVDSKPRGVFDSAAVQAAYKWKFKPKVVNGQPVAQRGIQTLEFNLSE